MGEYGRTQVSENPYSRIIYAVHCNDDKVIPQQKFNEERKLK